MAAKKAVIGGMAAILLVAAIVGVVAVVVRSSHSSSVAAGNGDGGLSTTSKSVSAICSPTLYRDACEKTLTKALNGSVEPKDIIRETVKATIDEARAAFAQSGSLSQNITDSFNQEAMTECKRLFDVAMDDLDAVFSVSHDLREMFSRSDDVRTWLTAVVSYQTACLENFNNTELRDAVEKGIRVVAEFTSNAMALFKEYSGIAEGVDLDLNITLGTGRRLLSDDGYPTWLSAGDRKLMAVRRGGVKPKPNVVVAKDGSGNFKTISQALAAMPEKYTGRYVIYVKAGVYNEQVTVDKKLNNNVFMYGDGAKRTTVTGRKNFIDGTPTSKTATFVVLGQGFIAKDMGFTNTAGAAKHQAVALRVEGDMAAFFNCRMDAYQDTLYVQSKRQFYRNCVVSGTVDFIFGDSQAVLQNCLLILRHPMDNQQNAVTAQGRTDPKFDSVIVIQNCRIVPDKSLFPDRFKIKSYLGRPWKNYARTVFMESLIGDVIQPAGYMEWPGNNMNLPLYGEYANRGPGAVTTGRVKWRGVRVISRQEAQAFTAGVVLEKSNKWLQYTGGRYFTGFRH